MRLRGLVWCGVSWGLCAGAFGCGDDPPKERPTPVKAGGGASKDAPKGAPGADPAAPVAGAAPDFTWSETPAWDKVPDAPLGGVANEKPFPVVTVLVEPGLKGWKIAFHDRALKRPTGLIVGSHHLDLHLEGDSPAVGKKFEKPMAFGGGYWQLPKPGDDTKATSWNAPNAYLLEFTKWDVKPWDPEGPAFQSAGTASGRVAVVYKGSGEFKDSWLAGHFEGATVRYMGRPYFAVDAPPPAPDAGAAAKSDAGAAAPAPGEGPK